MRVLLVAHGFPPSAMGGTEIYTHDLGHALSRSCGAEVIVLAREADPERSEYSVRELDQGGLHIYLINNTFRRCRTFSDTYRNPVIRSIGAAVIDRIAPDIAHLQHLTCLSTELVLELAARRVPVVFTLNDYWLLCHRGQLLDMGLARCAGPHVGCEGCIRGEAGHGRAGYRAARLARGLRAFLPGAVARQVDAAARAGGRLLERRGRATSEGEQRTAHMRWIASHVTRFLAPSHTLRRHFIDFGVPADRITHVQQGIDHRRLQGIERVPGARLRIGFLGSMMVSKAPHLLLEAFRGLQEGSASLEIFGGFAGYHGDDSYRQRVEPLLDWPGVHHHGSIPHAEVPRALTGLDVLVICSVWLENAPFVIREAFVAGLPVIASDIGGMAEMVRHGVDGLLFRAGHAGALRDALKRLIDEPGLLERLSAGIRPMMSIEEDAAQLATLYADLVAEHRPAPSMAAVVLNYQTPLDTVLAVRSLRTVAPVTVVDNGSADSSVVVLRERIDGTPIVETGRNLGFSGGVNVGVRAALEGGADAVLVLNGDVMLGADAPRRLAATLACDPALGIVAPLVVDRAQPSVIASAGLSFERFSGRMHHIDAGRRFDPREGMLTRRVAAVNGCAMLIRREVFDAIGLLDEDYFFSFEELDLCLRARRAGWESACVGDAIAYHAGSLSIGASSTRRLYFATRNHLLLARRAAPLPWPASAARASVILALNLAHALRCGWGPVGERIAQVGRGWRDHLRGRYGADG
jgi:GT2 family glycosyltransferase/glycosyltransferase involved in cell wall biosynthesis